MQKRWRKDIEILQQKKELVLLTPIDLITREEDEISNENSSDSDYTPSSDIDDSGEPFYDSDDEDIPSLVDEDDADNLLDGKGITEALDQNENSIYEK